MRSLEAVRFLLEKFPYSVDVNFSSTFERAPLKAAARNGHLDVVKLLLSKGADSVLFNAAFMGHSDVAWLLCEHGANVNSSLDDDISVLHGSARGGHAEFVEYLIDERQASMSHHTTGNLTVLDIAVLHADAVRVLLSHGAGIENDLQESSSTLCRAVLLGCLDAVKVLVEHGADVNAKYIVWVMTAGDFVLTPLAVAVINRELGIVQYLCENGADVQPTSDQNESALHLAAGKGLTQIVEYLVNEQDANLESVSSFGFTPAEVAEGNDEIEVLRFLLESGFSAMK